MTLFKTLSALVLAAGLSGASTSFAQDAPPLAMDEIVVFGTAGDAVLAAKIRSAISGSSLAALPIGVWVFDRIAYLSGTVDTAYDAELAVDIAASIEGVSKVYESIGTNL